VSPCLENEVSYGRDDGGVEGGKEEESIGAMTRGTKELEAQLREGGEREIAS
jgi:hypothetical protein